MKKITIDTNAYSSFLRGDERILNVFSNANNIHVSIFVIAELYSGLKGGSKEQWNKDLLQRFLNKPAVRIVDATIETAEIFADIKHTLKKTGNPLPINDVWIASHAVESGSVLITYDEHFNKIPGLRLWDFIKK